MMEPLSPRSTNILPKPKPEPTKSASAKPMPADKPASTDKPRQQKSQKDHAPSPPQSVREPGKNGELYTTGEFLGKGGFAICYQGELARNNRVFAMKVVKSEMPQRKMQDKFRTELQIHSKMRHPNIVAFHRAFTFEKNIYVILELCSNGSIMEMVKRRKCLTLPEVRRFTIQLCGAVKYLHKRNVAHRDLKMGNMFLDHNMDVKVGDFGLAAIILSEKDERRRKTLCGTPNYIAPEVLDKSKGGHTQKVDIWSIGVICFAMLAGYPPFQSSTQEEIYKKVKNLSYAWPKDKETGNYIPNEAKSLVSVCLSLDENERPEPDEIVDHPFFNMYPGCIPRQLESECRHSRPAWIKHQDPRGDRMSTGCSLENDPKYASKILKVRGSEERYAVCKHEFYAECGVGRTPSGVIRKSVGKRCSKTAWAECAAEEALGLQPLMPLPTDRVYSYHAVSTRDWSVPDAGIGNESTSSTGDDEEQDSKVTSKIQAAKAARSQQALATQLRRKDAQPKSHAATLRQPAPQPAPVSQASSRDANVKIQPTCQAATGEAARPTESEPLPSAQNLLSERPIRNGARVASGYQGSLRERARPTSTVLPKSESAPMQLTAAKTRSQSRQQLMSHSRTPSSPERRKEDGAEAPKSRPTMHGRVASLSRGLGDVKLDSQESRNPPQRVPSPQQKASRPANTDSVDLRGQSQDSCAVQIPQSKEIPPKTENLKPVTSVQPEKSVPREERNTEAKSTANGSQKSRSTLGVGPLIHPDEGAEVLAGTSVSEVIPELRAYLSEFRQRQRGPTNNRSRRHQLQKYPRHYDPHAYVVKWVDYTNRYGIGYILDDGSVGCIFKAEHGRPASCVLLRDGERHIRLKARARGSPEGPHVYSECGQLVPRKGKPVEFYENVELDTASCQGGGVRRVLIQPGMFEVKHLQLSAPGEGRAERTTASVERPKCEAEKVKRVKLVDQFGKYMIGSLGRNASEDGYGDEEGKSGSDSQAGGAGPFVKFYQRLGNVGIWGFGDGAFQFNFPDHTKVVISLRKSHHTSQATSCQIDFYHLSPSAARYLASRGIMHPEGFDTRSGISEDACTFISALSGAFDDCQPVSGISAARFHDILEANSFRDKLDFIEDVLTSWVRNGRLGGRITSALSKYSSSSSRAVSASSASSTGTTASTATTRSNGTRSYSPTLSTAPTFLGSCEGQQHPPSENLLDAVELFWAGPQEKSWQNQSGGKFVWVSVGAQGSDGEYMSLVLKGKTETRNEVQCVGAEGQDYLKERLKALAS